MEFSKIRYSVKGALATISLDSPKNLNAFDEVMIEEIVTALSLCEEAQGVKVVVLNSTSKAFSVGGDIGYMYKGIKSGNLNFGGGIEKMASVSMAIKRLSKPVIASVSGAVAGAGFNVALACDFCIAASDAKFMQAFVNIGLVPDAGGFYLLTRAVGVNKAVELAFTGRPVAAVEGKALGFITQVTEDLEGATQKLAEQLSAGPATSYACMKRLILESQFKDFEAYIAEEVKAQTLCGDTADFKEGVCAFVEKRLPNFGF